MAWCQNQKCRKQGLSKNDVEFCEDTKMVLCTGCYALRHPGWMPPNDFVVGAPQTAAVVPEFSYELHFTSGDGFSARVAFGDLVLGVHAPMEEIRRYFGGEEQPA
jgi:hypothetical protein